MPASGGWRSRMEEEEGEEEEEQDGSGAPPPLLLLLPPLLLLLPLFDDAGIVFLLSKFEGKGQPIPSMNPIATMAPLSLKQVVDRTATTLG